MQFWQIISMRQKYSFAIVTTFWDIPNKRFTSISNQYKTLITFHTIMKHTQKVQQWQARQAMVYIEQNSVSNGAFVLSTALHNMPWGSRQVVCNAPQGSHGYSVSFKTPAATRGSHQLPQGSPKQTPFIKIIVGIPECEGLSTEWATKAGAHSMS